MNTLIMLSLMIILILLIMLGLVNFMAKETFKDREKSSPFECGFDPKSYSRLPFSLHFFLIAIIFLIFDVEITLLLPLIVSMKISNLVFFSWTISFFVLILIIGLIHEWNQGALNWIH